MKHIYNKHQQRLEEQRDVIRDELYWLAYEKANKTKHAAERELIKQQEAERAAAAVAAGDARLAEASDWQASTKYSGSCSQIWQLETSNVSLLYQAFSSSHARCIQSSHSPVVKQPSHLANTADKSTLLSMLFLRSRRAMRVRRVMLRLLLLLLVAVALVAWAPCVDEVLEEACLVVEPALQFLRVSLQQQ